MLEAHRENRDEYTESIARNLLSSDDLPLLIRAQALACSEEPDYLEMAGEAVRIAEVIKEIARGPVERRILESAKTVRKESYERSNDAAGENEDTNDDELILVWQPENVAKGSEAQKGLEEEKGSKEVKDKEKSESSEMQESKIRKA